ncbi:hypothetical protein [Halorubrum salinum]|nr:hypothetical protein [Halorubrum salinum]
MGDDPSDRGRTDAGRSRTYDPGADPSAQAESSQDDCGSAMLARAWVIAARYGDPTAYGIPEPPSMSVSETDAGGIALSTAAGADPFIRAGNPVPIQR